MNHFPRDLDLGARVLIRFSGVRIVQQVVRVSSEVGLT